MYMRRPQTGVRASGIRSRLDGLHPVTTFRIGRQDSEPLEIGIERRRIDVARVRVATASIGLPDLDARALNRLPFPVQDTPHQMDHLSRRGSRSARDGG